MLALAGLLAVLVSTTVTAVHRAVVLPPA